MARPRHVLFICARNQWRSPTAERIYRRDPSVQTRSRGVSSKARQRLVAADIEWADLIIVMETKHKQRVLASFPDATRFKPLHVLDIPDDYRFMDPELIELLRPAVDAILGDE